MVIYKDKLSGTRKDMADTITQELELPMTTPEIRDKLWEEHGFKNQYKNKKSFHRVLNYVKDQLIEDEVVETEKVPGEGSRMTAKWFNRES